jgi:hypothetical protein
VEGQNSTVCGFGGTLQNDLAVHMQNRQSQFAKNLPTNIFDFKSSVVGPEPDPHGSRIYFGSRRAKWPTKIEKKEISGFEVLDVLFLRAEGFSCSSDVWRPRDKKISFLLKKNIFSAVKFVTYWSSKSWIQIRTDLKCWIRVE